MQWSNVQPFVPTDLVDRLRLRRAALRYAAHGWAVTPGACHVGDRSARDGSTCDGSTCDGSACDGSACDGSTCDRSICDGSTCNRSASDRSARGRAGRPFRRRHPASASFPDDASTDAARVAAWWRRRPCPVLLATGRTFDVLEAPAPVGLRALGTERLHADVLGAGRTGGRGPVAVGPTGRWMFFVRPGTALRPELDGCLDIVRHGPGSRVPAPPSRLPEGPVRWAVAPHTVGWELPEAEAVQAMLVDALAALGRRIPARHAQRPVTVPRQLSTSRRAL
jgi:Bifunctional DNA primase/polymerase, N-terminal